MSVYISIFKMSKSFSVTVFSTGDQFLWTKGICENFDNLQNIENDVTALFDSFTNLSGKYVKLVKHVDKHLRMAKNQISNTMTNHQKNMIFGRYQLFEKSKEVGYLYEKLEANFNELQKANVFLKNASTQFCDPRYIFAYLGIAPAIYNGDVFDENAPVFLHFIGQEGEHGVDYPSANMVKTCDNLRRDYLQKMVNVSLPNNESDKFHEIMKLCPSE